MNEAGKFSADIKRAVKRERAQNGGRYNAKAACASAARSLQNESRDADTLPAALGEWWLQKYIARSERPDDEPRDENIERLCALSAFLRGDEGECGALSRDDWKEIERIVNERSGTLPVETLARLMSVLVSRKALD